MIFKVMGLDEITKEVNTDRKSKRKGPCNTPWLRNLENVEGPAENQYRVTSEA